MNLSAEGLNLIKQEEGCDLHTYPDCLGLPTIGYGHLIKPGETFPDGITTNQAEDMLLADVARFEADVNREVTVPMTQGEFDALVDFEFNLGDRLPSSTLLRLLNSGQTEAARQQLEAWDFAGGKPNAAIKARRVLEMDLWAKGDQG
jgi:lysozyme